MSKIIFGKIYCDRIADKDVGIVEQCLFVSLSSRDKGSAIYFSSLKTASLTIRYSCFRYCIGQKEGGSIYFKSKKLFLINSCFDSCYSESTYDKCYGSAIYSDSEDIFSQRNAFHYCGPSGTQTGDSTQFHKASNYCHLDYLNSTKCHNKCGTTGPYLNIRLINVCVVKHINIVQCSGLHIFGNIGSNTETYYLNAVNTSATEQQLFTYSKIHFYYSYIYFVHFEGMLYGSITFTECYGNFACEGVKTDAGTITGNYHMKRGDGCVLVMIESKKIKARSILGISSLLLITQETFGSKQCLLNIGHFPTFRMGKSFPIPHWGSPMGKCKVNDYKKIFHFLAFFLE